MNCSTKECPNKAMPETTSCGCDYFCGCEIQPLCEPCYDAMERESYEWIETLGNAGFNAFYLAHLPDDDMNDDFYIGYIQSLVRG
ncbi:MAG: hypothetical protein DMF62_04945 [Acidobacteria bacterium]|nr:MAG: hypothetical protein DMF62_04945 [Acidobacteriota bacterium]